MKLTSKEIYDMIDQERKCGSDNLLQHLLASEFSKTGMDVILNKNGFYDVVKGNTMKVGGTMAKRIGIIQVKLQYEIPKGESVIDYLNDVKLPKEYVEDSMEIIGTIEK